jgi:APA family basic amino acid/polyamine antiporter
MKHKIGLYTALSIVVANMIGTGVFTSLGFQLFGTSDIAAILLLWIIGGGVAILGSFAYSELGAAIPKSGGEYRFLSDTYHPFVGFLSGWVSATIGFAAPIAAAAWALGKYLNTINPGLSAQWVGFIVILLVTIVQSTNHRIGGGFQRYATSIKIGLILVFIIVGAFATTQLDFSILPTAATWHDMVQPSFAVSLVYVSYAYSGWNASSYIAGEMDKPERNIPISILGGTLARCFALYWSQFYFFENGSFK